MSPPRSLSVFFPIYNDAPTIEFLVRTCKGILPELVDDWEIILVDDCSPDESGAIADRLAAEDPRVRVIHHARNRGYGGALKSGFAAARKEWVFYTDGDGQYDVRELPLLLDRAVGADLVNGYKIARGDRFYRKLLGFIYHSAVKTLFGLHVRDVDCDFRLIRRSVFDRIGLESSSGVICAEMMTKIEGSGARIVEIPVHHYPRVAGRSQFFRFGRILSLLVGLARQWWLLVAREGKRSGQVNLYHRRRRRPRRGDAEGSGHEAG